MNKVYVNGLGSVSAQKTHDNALFLDEIVPYEDNVLYAHGPDYKTYIPPAAARRMAKGIKMGVAASKIAMEEAGLDQVDAIITGTGMGCVRDSEKFVSALLDHGEQYLTPTAFIQSTHNTVGGQIALGLDCKGYNFTYVHASISFESALIDAQMQLQNGEAANILVGGIDENGDHTIKIHRLIGHIKDEKVGPMDVLDSGTRGAVFGEGANFFVLSHRRTNGSYAEVLDVRTYNTLPGDRLSEVATDFLGENGLAPSDIDVLVLGHNGDVAYDSFYDKLRVPLFDHALQLCYKHLSGEFNTASSFGFWLGAKVLKTQRFPEAARRNGPLPTKMDTVLSYNQYRGENHGFTLLRKC